MRQSSTPVNIVTGVERLQINPSLINNAGRVGVVVNQACATSDFVSTVEVVHGACKKASGTNLTCVFGPQHGFFQTEQDNMIETPDLEYLFEDGSKLPLFSLYSQTREPTAEQLSQVDTLIVDLLDIGCRIYTYQYTLAFCLRAAARHNKKVIVLDRPNPLGLSQKVGSEWKRVEGNIMEHEKLGSFVGVYPIAIRPGMTLGELGQYFLHHDKLTDKVKYEVIRCENLKRDYSLLQMQQYFANRWTLPSPNMPMWQSSLFFIPFVSIEGTNVSEGRGTTLPFQLIAAPHFDHRGYIRALRDAIANNANSSHSALRGVVPTLHKFRPTFNKHQGGECQGVFFHYDPHQDPNESVNLFALGIQFLHFCCTDGNWFEWKKPGYEYNYKDSPILLILGSERWRELLPEHPQSAPKGPVGEEKMNELLRWSHNEAQKFAEEMRPFHLYA